MELITAGMYDCHYKEQLYRTQSPYSINLEHRSGDHMVYKQVKNDNS